MKVKPIFAWYDMWIGMYWDRKNRKLYVLPLPCLGFVIEWPKSKHGCIHCGENMMGRVGFQVAAGNVCGKCVDRYEYGDILDSTRLIGS
jgi:hypothetical protein